MSRDENSGYRGQALEAIRKAQVEIGNLVRISDDDKSYEGILIPRSEYGDAQHIVVKLKNGYNIGIKIKSETKIEKLGTGTKPSFVAPPEPKQNPKLPKVTIISTGGTIASRVDYRTGAVRSALTANDLYSVVPELSDIAQINARILFSIFSENINPKHWTEIALTVKEELDRGCDGIVIAHGTDTMGYTAAALSFALHNLPVPVVLVGSQRSADRPSSDAATNLIGAVTAAASAPFAEVVLAFHETPSDNTIALHRGTKVRKCHTSRRDTFKSVNATPIAQIRDSDLGMLTEEYYHRDHKRDLKIDAKFDERVALLKFYPGMSQDSLSFYVDKGFKGLILEGTGLGHVSSNLFDSIDRGCQNGIVVCMTSQCIWGRVNMNVYDTGRDLQSLGVVPLEDMLPETALVKLMWVLGQTNDCQKAREMMITSIAGEISPRTLSEKMLYE